MIVTLTTVVVVVIGLLSLCLALYGGLVSMEIAEGMRGDSEATLKSEQKYYLLSMIGIIVLLARIVNVPLFFWMLQSLVPFCPGAMCAYGVMNVGFPYSLASLGLKVILPFVYGLWMIIEVTNRRHPMLPFTRLLSRSFLMVLLPMVLFDSAVDILTVAAIRPVYAPCCSSIYDVAPPFSPSAILGVDLGRPMTAIMVILSLTVIIAQWTDNRLRWSRYILLLVPAVTALLYLLVLHDFYAPMVLGLTNHHCPFCLFQEYPDTALFTALFWLGSASAVWRSVIMALWKRDSLPFDQVAGILTLLRKVSSVAIVFSMVSLLTHVLIAV